MKNRKLIMFLHFIALLAALFGLLALFRCLRSAWGITAQQSAGLLPLLLVVALSFPVAVCGEMVFGLLTGYKLKELSLPFVTFRPGQGLRPNGRIRVATLLAPPAVSSDVPFRLFLLGAPVTLLIFSALMTALACILRATPAAPWLLDTGLAWSIMACTLLLPRKNQTDILTKLVLMSRHPQLRLAWTQYMAIGASQGNVADMPEEWFSAYEAPLLAHPYPMTITMLFIARAIRRQRFEDAYPAVQGILSIPDPGSPHVHPCMLCQGALCEVLGDFPADCVNRLEEDAVRYLLPENWKARLLLARYGRERCITRDDEAAGAILAELQPLLDSADRRNAEAEATLLRLIDEKAGVPAAKEPDDAP